MKYKCVWCPATRDTSPKKEHESWEEYNARSSPNRACPAPDGDGHLWIRQPTKIVDCPAPNCDRGNIGGFDLLDMVPCPICDGTGEMEVQDE